MSTQAFLEFLNLDFDKIQHANARIAILIASFVALTILAKIILKIFRGSRHVHNHSGFVMSKENRQGMIFRVIYMSLRIGVVLAMALFLWAFADPFLNHSTEELRITQSRIRVDIRDTSSSMELSFRGSSVSRAEVAANAHAQFVKMRFGKKDRTSLWIFGSFPYQIERFIIDDELYYNQVVDAPWVTWNGDIEEWFKNNPTWHVPKERYNITSNDAGGTDMVLVLKAVIKQFDNDREGKILENEKAVVIVTDGFPYEFPEAELKELGNRNVTPYVILIDEGDIQVPDFAQKMEDYGGKYFQVRDENGLSEAFTEIDRREKVQVESTIKLFKINLFQKFLITAIIFLWVTIVAGILIELSGIYP